MFTNKSSTDKCKVKIVFKKNNAIVTVTENNKHEKRKAV